MVDKTNKVHSDPIAPSGFHSDEVEEIMGKKPAWIIRWGITVIIAILLGIILACCIIKYPQTVKAVVILSSENPSSDLMARSAGILDSVYVSNGESVEKGQLLALIANAASVEDILKTEDILQHYSQDDPEKYAEMVVGAPEKQLGEVQSSWLELKSACKNYVDYIRIDQIGKKKRLLASQVSQAKDYYKQLERQRKYLEEELRYEQLDLSRDSLLLHKKAIAEVEYENTQKAVISKKNSLVSFDATMSSALLSRLQTEQEILELDIRRASEVAEFERHISQATSAMQSQIAIWKEQYAIVSPCDGQVSLQNVWNKGQHVNTGELIASVNPFEGTSVIGRVKVPSTGFGKVATGQEVIIKLNGFPYLEYGILRGVVVSISSVPEKTQEGLFYTIDVALPNGLMSSYHKPLPFVQDMDGIAEIVTEDMRLVEQFIRPIRSLFLNR